jgi:cytochrome c biogenesis protein CcdA
VRTLGIVLPILAVVLLALAVAVAPDRRRAITRAGVTLGVAGGALAIVLLLVRAYVVHHVYAPMS